MRIGISMASAYGVDDARTGARYMVERARAAHAAGLDSLFVGDHHATPAPYYQNSPILGRVLAEWGEREAGALYLLPLWNPVLVAEQTATLSTIARGPFVLQCAIGGGRSQFASMGVGYGGKPAKFEEALSIIRALWRGETVDGPEGHWPVAGARIAPVPPEPIEVWIGASAQPAIDRAARAWGMRGSAAPARPWPRRAGNWIGIATPVPPMAARRSGWRCAATCTSVQAPPKRVARCVGMSRAATVASTRQRW